MSSNVLVRVLEWTTSPTDAPDTIDHGVGCIELTQRAADSNNEFLVRVCNDVSRTELLIDTSTSVRRDGDHTIVLSAANSSTEHAVIFADDKAATILWIAVSLLMSTDSSSDADSLVTVPTLENIALLQQYLRTVHPLMRALIARSVARPGFLASLFQSFGAAEVQSRFDLLPRFREVMLSLFQLNSRPVLSLLLSSENIDRTIACMEYAPSLHACKTFQTTNRLFLNYTKLRCVLPSLHDRFKAFAYANYRIAYLKNLVCHDISEAALATIDSISINNSCSIAEVLLSDSKFAKTLTGCIIPVMVSLNDKLVLTSESNESALRFLIELFALPIPQSGMRRLVRKLCDSRLLEVLDQSFASSTRSSAKCLTLDVFDALQTVAPARVFEHVLNSQSLLTTSMVKLLTDSSQVSSACDRSLEFLQALIVRFDPVNSNAEHNTLIEVMVNRLLQALVHSMALGGPADKQRKVCDFVGYLIQTRPYLCRTRFGGCVTWFVSLADRALIDLDLSAQQKQLCLSSVRLLNNAAAVSDDFFVRSLLSRTGFADSILLTLLSNSGSDNMLSSVVQGMVCKMAQHWLTSLLDGRASVLIKRLPAKALHNSLRQLMCAFSAAANAVCASSSPGAPVHANTVAPLQRKDSLDDVYANGLEANEKVECSTNGSPNVDFKCSEPLKSDLTGDNSRLIAECDQLKQQNALLTTAQSKLQSENESMSLQLREMRRQLAVHRLAAAAGTAVRRQQNAALGRWKSVVVEKPEPVQAPAEETQSDPFLMDALYVLAWQRKVDRARAMALALRLSLLPLLKRRHLRRALHSWRESVQAHKATLPVVVVQKHVTFLSQLPPTRWALNVAQSPSSSRSLISEDSRSSIRSPGDSAQLWHRHSTFSPNSITPTPHSGVSIDLKHASISSMSSTMSMRDLGEAIGEPSGIKRKDSEMFFLIRNLKIDPFLGCASEPSFAANHVGRALTNTPTHASA